MTSRTISLDVIMTGTATSSARIVKRSTKTADYTITSSDYLIACDSTSNAITITLPVASSVPYYMFRIVDEAGTASTNNITITRSSSDTIIGETSVIINVNYNAVTIYSDGVTGYHIM